MNLNRNATLAEVGEFPLIAAITQGLSLAPDVSVGPGDDAAVLMIKDAVATSVDVLVEGVHFRRDWSEARDVGRKAVAVNVADIEAIGARATGLLVGFSAPPDLSLGWVLDFADGLGEEAKAAGVSLLGGDVTRARDITIAITALGTLDERRPVLRSGARPGDLVAIRGRLGWAAGGLAVLGRGFRSPRVLVEAHRVPQVSYGAGAIAARAGATSMIDISDGLLPDLGHVARRLVCSSSCGRMPSRSLNHCRPSPQRPAPIPTPCSSPVAMIMPWRLRSPLRLQCRRAGS